MKRLAIQNIPGRFQHHTRMVDIHIDVLLNDKISVEQTSIAKADNTQSKRENNGNEVIANHSAFCIPTLAWTPQ